MGKVKRKPQIPPPHHHAHRARLIGFGGASSSSSSSSSGTSTTASSSSPSAASAAASHPRLSSSSSSPSCSPGSSSLSPISSSSTISPSSCSSRASSPSLSTASWKSPPLFGVSDDDSGIGSGRTSSGGSTSSGSGRSPDGSNNNSSNNTPSKVARFNAQHSNTHGHHQQSQQHGNNHHHQQQPHHHHNPQPQQHQSSSVRNGLISNSGNQLQQPQHHPASLPSHHNHQQHPNHLLHQQQQQAQPPTQHHHHQQPPAVPAPPPQVKAPFAKRTLNALPPPPPPLTSANTSGLSHHHHQHHNFAPPAHSSSLPVSASTPASVVNFTNNNNNHHLLEPSSMTLVSSNTANIIRSSRNCVVNNHNGTGNSVINHQHHPNHQMMMPARQKVTATPAGSNPHQYNQNSIINNRLAPCAYPSRSKNGKYELKILSQPEEQHRARYLTEGSRGAIKDKSGHGYPIVKLCGYTRQPLKIQCFIGHDKHIGVPHLFYQASKIAGKNSTACFIKKVDGTSIITMEASPANNMEVNVDCIGILKERNVDVEQKLNKFQKMGGNDSSDDSQSVTNIKRSTRCRLVFRCEIPETSEILQTVSSPILCTQPLGTPEINKKSMSHANVDGGEELFIIGKNFLKDAKVIFRNERWFKIVEPNREYLKSTHLICKIPPYDLPVPRTKLPLSSQHTRSLPDQVIEVSLMVKSGGKCSEPQKFYYRIPFSSGSSPPVQHHHHHHQQQQKLQSPSPPSSTSPASSSSSSAVLLSTVRTDHLTNSANNLIEANIKLESDYSPTGQFGLDDKSLQQQPSQTSVQSSNSGDQPTNSQPVQESAGNAAGNLLNAINLETTPSSVAVSSLSNVSGSLFDPGATVVVDTNSKDNEPGPNGSSSTESVPLVVCPNIAIGTNGMGASTVAAPIETNLDLCSASQQAQFMNQSNTSTAAVVANATTAGANQPQQANNLYMITTTTAAANELNHPGTLANPNNSNVTSSVDTSSASVAATSMISFLPNAAAPDSSPATSTTTGTAATTAANNAAAAAAAALSSAIKQEEQLAAIRACMSVAQTSPNLTASTSSGPSPPMECSSGSIEQNFLNQTLLGTPMEEKQFNAMMVPTTQENQAMQTMHLAMNNVGGGQPSAEYPATIDANQLSNMSNVVVSVNPMQNCQQSFVSQISMAPSATHPNDHPMAAIVKNETTDNLTAAPPPPPQTQSASQQQISQLPQISLSDINSTIPPTTNNMMSIDELIPTSNDSNRIPALVNHSSMMAPPTNTTSASISLMETAQSNASNGMLGGNDFSMINTTVALTDTGIKSNLLNMSQAQQDYMTTNQTMLNTMINGAPSTGTTGMDQFMQTCTLPTNTDTLMVNSTGPTTMNGQLMMDTVVSIPANTNQTMAMNIMNHQMQMATDQTMTTSTNAVTGNGNTIAMAVDPTPVNANAQICSMMAPGVGCAESTQVVTVAGPSNGVVTGSSDQMVSQMTAGPVPVPSEVMPGGTSSVVAAPTSSSADASIRMTGTVAMDTTTNTSTVNPSGDNNGGNGVSEMNPASPSSSTATVLANNSNSNDLTSAQSNINPMSKMSEAELIGFIKPETFE